FLLFMLRRSLRPPLFPYTTLFRSEQPQENPPEADAHWISGSNVGLSIYTADCAPLMIVHRDRDKVAAFHCGWRGVAAKLLEKNRSEEHTSELQSRENLVCRLLLEK